MTSKVYFADLRARNPEESTSAKFKDFLRRQGLLSSLVQKT
jgi:hypothetical protein